jgi:hypothetical protein
MDQPYKFQFEYEEVAIGDTSKECSRVKFVTYGYTANEALEAHKEFLDAWNEFLEKEAECLATNRNGNELMPHQCRTRDLSYSGGYIYSNS